SLRAMPATNPVSPPRAPFDKPRMSMGAFTADDVMFTMRPNLRSAILSTVALMSSIGVSMLASTAFDPGIAVELPEVAGRRAARVRDQDVGVRARGERGRTALGCCDVARD